MKRIICSQCGVSRACGSSNGGSPDGAAPANSVTGTVDGHTLNVQDAVFTFTSNYPVEHSGRRWRSWPRRSAQSLLPPFGDH